MPTFFQDQKLTLSSTSTWETVDLSGYVPTNAAVAFLKLHNPNGYSYTIIARSYDSTQTFSTEGGHGGSLRDYDLAPQAVKIGSSRRISIYRTQSAMEAYIYGYLTTDEVYAFDPMPYFNAPVAGDWGDVDISPYISNAALGNSRGVLLQIMNTPDTLLATDHRPVGSTWTPPTLTGPSQAYGGLVAMKLPAGNKIQVYGYNTTGIKFFVVGLLKKDILETYNTPVDVSPSTTSTWETISTLPANAIAGIYTVYSGGRYQYGLKGVDSTDTLTQGYVERRFSFGYMPTGTNNQIQGYKNNSSVLIYETGYWKTPSGSEFFAGTNY